MEVSKKLIKICDQHGEYQAEERKVPFMARTFETGCPGCEEEARRKSEEEQARQSAERRERAIIGNLDRAGIPKRFRNRNFANYKADSVDQQRAKKKVQAYADNFDQVLEDGQSMIFSGTTGTGKTHLANAVANQIMREGRSAVFITVRDLVSRVKATWSRSSDKSEAEVKKQFIAVDLLILDEVGVQFDTEAEKLIMFDVINGRYEEIKPTIVLSNFPVDAEDGKPSIRKVLGDRVLDRLREGGGKMIAFDWSSYRSEV